MGVSTSQQLANPIVTYPVLGSDVSASANIPYTALQRTQVLEEKFGQPIGGTPTTVENIVHVANGAETVIGFHVACYNTGSAASVTVDLKKNGTSILSGVVTVTNATPSRTKQNATIASPSLVDGDVLSMALTVSSSTGMQGPYAQLVLSGGAPS